MAPVSVPPAAVLTAAMAAAVLENLAVAVVVGGGGEGATGGHGGGGGDLGAGGALTLEEDVQEEYLPEELFRGGAAPQIETETTTGAVCTGRRDLFPFKGSMCCLTLPEPGNADVQRAAASAQGTCCRSTCRGPRRLSRRPSPRISLSRYLSISLYSTLVDSNDTVDRGVCWQEPLPLATQLILAIDGAGADGSGAAVVFWHRLFRGGRHHSFFFFGCLGSTAARTPAWRRPSRVRVRFFSFCKPVAPHFPSFPVLGT